MTKLFVEWGSMIAIVIPLTTEEPHGKSHRVVLANYIKQPWLKMDNKWFVDHASSSPV